MKWCGINGVYKDVSECKGVHDICECGKQRYVPRRPAEQAAPTEPVLYQKRMRPTWNANRTPWSDWEDCSKEAYEQYLKVPLLHDWAYEVRALCIAAHPQGAADRSAEAKEVERWKELADSEGSRAVNYLRRARKAEALLRQYVDRYPSARSGYPEMYAQAIAAMGAPAAAEPGNKA